MTALAERYPPIRIRPDEPGPRKTLGDQVIIWAMKNLVHAVTGEPWVPLPEHEHFINCYYEIDENGDWVYSQAYLRRARGTAKSPLAAVIAAIELCGPCRFGGWDEDGYPIAVPEPAPWVQIMATSIEQTRAIFDIVANSFSLEAIAEYRLEIGREAIIKQGRHRGRLQVIPNNARSIRGARPTFIAVDETSELVIANGGHESMDRVNGNLDKNPGGRARRLDLSNAFIPGEDSVAERVMMTWSEQMSKWGFSHILMDALEANPNLRLTDPAELREAIRQASGDATWLNVERLVRSALRVGPNVVSIFRREHLNQITSEEDSLISAQMFDRRTPPSIEVLPLEPGQRVALGFDGSLSGDGTALVALRLSDMSFHLLHYQEPDPMIEDWRVDEEAVDDAVRLAFDRYEVWGAACDLHPFESWVMAWNRDFGDLMKVPASTTGPLIRDNRSARRDLTLGCESLVGEIESEKILFSSSYRMRTHWLNAKRAENRYGFSFRKVTKDSRKRVDIVAACLMAYLIVQKLLAANIEEPKARRGVAMSW
jgi:hypothetical protein